MKKELRTAFAAIVVAWCMLLAGAAGADTGTYKIADYQVKLTPRANGIVEIEYYQKWLITGGHIPWITVGVPNSQFEFVPGKTGGAVKKIAPANEGGWSGVRIDLDRDYTPGQSFEIRFAIQQHRIFSAGEKDYKLDFTPGWYDRAPTERLRIEIFFFAKMEGIAAKPQPTRVEGQSMIWEKSNLREGEKLTVSVSIPKQAFPGQIAGSELKSAGGGASMPGALGVLVVILLFMLGHPFLLFIAFVIISILISAIRGQRHGYAGGGSIFGGGLGGGAGDSGRHAGGGGGFGGRSASCACACVSCACACACAGGGGAGCDRKLSRTCPLCRKCDRTDCAFHRTKVDAA